MRALNLAFLLTIGATAAMAQQSTQTPAATPPTAPAASSQQTPAADARDDSGHG